MLTVGFPILRMQCTATNQSGTVRWSGLLPTSRETVITHSKRGLGGGVRRGQPLRRRHRGFVVEQSR